MNLEASIFIPIKSESQRVPNKNFRDFEGVPLWEHTIKKFENFKVYVDTDSENLIERLRKYSNVTAYLREKSLRGHNVSVCDLIKFWVEKENPKGFLFQVHVTSPFLKIETILNSIDLLKKGHDSVASCTVHKSRFWFLGNPVNHDPNFLIQTQDLVPLLEENSLFYGFTKELAKEGKRIGVNPSFFPTDKLESMDIDTESDWEDCLRMMKILNWR